VFAGAGLTESDYDRVDLGLIDLFPPIRRGDLITAMDQRYPVIAIIDGEFYQSLAVSPKEILVTLRAGIQVIGGSSMGALRAAEMNVYGMEGIGQIYRWYRSGVVYRDDDVALLYGQVDDLCFRAATVPMVNVLWASREFRRLGTMAPQVRRRMSAAARGIHWSRRTWEEICRRARLDEDDRAKVRDWAADPGNDLKRVDACRVVEYTTAVMQAAAIPERATATREAGGVMP
jgi:TfuA protein